MGGSNPYIEAGQIHARDEKFKVTFVREGKTVEVDPEKVPYAREGLPGSILDIATGFHMGLDHACGGVCACSTCHVSCTKVWSPATNRPTPNSTSSTKPRA